MPISFSAWCIISLVMRGAGVGDGLGEGVGDGDAVCARASNGSFDATRPAAPSAGRLLTKFRLAMFASFARGVLLFLFIVLGSDADARRDYHRRHQVCRL